MAELTQETIDVLIGTETFIFKIPTPREHARVSSRAAMLRATDTPGAFVSEWSLDPDTAGSYRAMAIMEILLQKADTEDNWCYSNNDEGKPVVDSNKFPAKTIRTLPLIARGFEEGLQKFLEGGAGNGKPEGKASVGGEPGGS